MEKSVVAFILAVLGLCGFCVFGSLVHVFYSAKVAARHSQLIAVGSRLAKAVVAYTLRHDGRLPGANWPEDVTRIDPSLRPLLTRRVNDRWVGFAAVPSTLGKRPDDLKPEAILFVEYDLDAPETVLKSLSDIGDPGYSPGRAIAIQVADLDDGHTRGFRPTLQIQDLLRRQR